MSRQLINSLVATSAIGGAIVFSNVAWSNTAEPLGGRAYVTRAQFDQAFADTAAASRSASTPAYRERLRNVGWERLNGPITSK